MRLAVILLYVILLMLTFLSIICGTVSFYTTIILYSTGALILFLVTSIISKASGLKSNNSNINLTIISICLTLCVADLGLRYLIKPTAYFNYNERNGALVYNSNSIRQKFSSINHHFWKKGGQIGWIYANPADNTRWVSKTEYRYLHGFNHDGLRTDSIPLAKKKNEVRILTLGDSFTEGIGAPGDSTWPVLLQQQLAKTSSDTVYTVINAGVSGSDPFFELYLLKGRMLKYNPDIVIVATNASDINDIAERGGYERFAANGEVSLTGSPWWEPIYGASIIFRMVVRNVFHYTFNLVPEKEEVQRKVKAADKLVDAIEGFNQLSKASKFKLVVVLHPMLNELQGNKFELAGTQKILERDSILNIDLYSDYQDYFSAHHLKAENYFWPIDLHQNSAGYLIWSQIVFSKMKGQKVI